ncbi:hypothetical protein CRE_11413 [Caenorhabditis remanei]|uniref:Reverse transcriptase domain-containing protein n=1 Tax=Caenorhabditis remanei TaxID=31234 RepID=E3N758_CAERE|nr:hypothetical protein CRE_11413 [Caenorhabditis remanei]
MQKHCLNDLCFNYVISRVIETGDYLGQPYQIRFTIFFNNVFSSDRSVLSGVPQGSVLGPLLFLVFINDIGDAFESNFLLYAEDLKLFSTNADCIKNDLVRLSVWCDNWQMGVAPEKCEVISFNHSRKHYNSASLNFSINDAIISQTKIIRDLGIIFNSDLNFSNHLDVTLRKAHQRVNICIFQCFSVMLTSKFSSNVLKFMFVPFCNMGRLFSPPHLKNKLG